MASLNRRTWLKQSSLAAFGFSLTIPSIASDVCTPRNFYPPTLINLGSNENPYGISQKAKQAILEMFPDANRYQFNVPLLSNFRSQLAEHYGLKSENVLVTAGSGEALSLFARYFNKGNIVLGNPTFGILGNSARRIGTQLNEVPLTNQKLHDLPALRGAINSSTSLVYIVNPANPTGTVIPADDMKNFCREVSKQTTVLVDEAYIDFLDDPDHSSVKDLIHYHTNLVIVRTFSKIHGMAGLRVGFVMGHPSLIRKLDENYFSGSQFAVSNLSMAAALASLKDMGHTNLSKEKNAKARDYTQDVFRREGVEYIPSSTNFIFFRLKNYPGDFAEEMRKKNIILRAGNYADGKWGRISIGTLDEMKQFEKVIREEKSFSKM